MANALTVNPMYIDATCTVLLANTQTVISGIQILPSNATWAVTLKDGANNTVYHANNTTASNGFMSKSFRVTGLKVTTLTACTLLIYTDAS